MKFHTSLNLVNCILACFFICFTKSCSTGCATVQGKSISECVINHCPDGWVRFKTTKCFKYFQTPAVSHGATEVLCGQLQSTLASINSEDELRFLNSYIAREQPISTPMGTWVGGIRKEGLWFWSDLSQFSYTNWGPGQPAVAHCVYLNTRTIDMKDNPTHWGKMATSTCDNNNQGHYICQKYQIDSKKCICQLQ